MRIAATTLVFCVAALLALGLVMLYSSSMAQVGAHYVLMQLAWCVLAVAGFAFSALVDYRWLKKLALPMVLLALVMLALVLVVGVKHGGARRWFTFGRFSFQPSEFGKLAILAFLAYYGEKQTRHMHEFARGALIPGVVVGLLLGLILIEWDVGCTLLLAVVSAAMLLIAGIRWRYLVVPFLIGVVALGWFLSHNQNRSKRIYAWLHTEETRLDSGMQPYQSMVALGSGGVWGRGLGESRQKLGFVPANHTDYIFAIIGEEVGLAGTLSVLAGFALVVGCGFYIAFHAADVFGLLLGCGASMLIGIQAFINIGVVTNALPCKGMPLPFMSYGGSNLIFVMCAVGLLFSIARHAQAAEPGLRSVPEHDQRQ